VISVPELQAGIGSGDWIVLTPEGEIIEMKIPKDIGPATLMVGPVTDALKTVEDGRIVGSVDRERVWNVEAIALNRVVVRRLEARELTPGELYDTVRGFGLAWQFGSMPSNPG
jgi:hypothetical protein